MRYTKTESGLTNAQDIPKIKNFACAELVCDAVDNDELKVGEIFSVPVVNGIFDDLAGDISTIKSYIPNTTSVNNQLTNVSQVQDMVSGGSASLDACWTRLDNVETCANTNHSNIVQIGAVIPADAASSNQLVTNATLATCLSCKVDCSDLTLDLDAMHQDITDLKSAPGINCTGTLVASDLNAISQDITDLKSCSGLSCTGTLVPSDLNAINTEITCLNSCPGINCTGTLVASDIANKASCADVIALNDKVTELENCASITGILTSDTFSLSGNTLIITTTA